MLGSVCYSFKDFYFSHMTVKEEILVPLRPSPSCHTGYIRISGDCLIPPSRSCPNLLKKAIPGLSFMKSETPPYTRDNTDKWRSQHRSFEGIYSVFSCLHRHKIILK